MFLGYMAEHGKRKRKVRGKGKAPGKGTIISFRLEDELSSMLDLATHAVPISNIKSRGDMARKLVVDFLNGDMVYITPEHRSLDSTRRHQDQ